MHQLFIFIRVIYRLALFLLLFIIALVPLLVKVTPIVAFIALPMALILLSFGCLFIEHRLTKHSMRSLVFTNQTMNNKVSKGRKCPLKSHFCCNH
jgi:membrane protein YdbS with pleckstrin-like domain